MKKFKVLSCAIATTLCLTMAPTAFAGTATKALSVNTDPSDWDRPNAGNFVASYSAGDNYIYTALEGIYWSPAQIDNYEKAYGRYLTLDLKEDGTTHSLNGYSATTTLPDPKFDFEDDQEDESSTTPGYGRNEEVEVVSRGALSDWTRYNYTANFRILNSSANPYLITYASQSIPPLYPGGDYNNVPGVNTTGPALQGEYFNNFKTSNVSSSNSTKAAKTVGILSNKVEVDTHSKSKKAKVSKAYDDITNRKQLEDYKKKHRDLLDKKTSKKDNRNQKVKEEFTVTFNTPVTAKKIKETISKHNLKASVIYARGINNLGERVTIATTELTDESLNKIINSKDYSFKGFIEIEGEGSVADLNNVQNDAEVYAVETADTESTEHDIRPMGLSWKLEELNK
ncbi:hypothetical protein [Paenibacillus hamazuiensis]|uniref:hypothetical protein n=1 Tax=Paenibacillus hamazuiensis TaxID=2936508 RepID=UPI00200BC18C|nr:hypothetical protein [Paenibacillus hamazuiensis]